MSFNKKRKKVSSFFTLSLFLSSALAYFVPAFSFPEIALAADPVFAAPTTLLNESVSEMHSLDLDGDGFEDIVGTTIGAGFQQLPTFFYNNQSGGLETKYVPSLGVSYPTYQAFIDYDDNGYSETADGDLDVILSYTDAFSARHSMVLMMQNGIVVNTDNIMVTNSSNVQVAYNLFNNDVFLDYAGPTCLGVGCNLGDNQLRITTTSSLDFPINAQAVFADNFTNNSEKDYVVAVGGRLEVYKKIGSNLTPVSTGLQNSLGSSTSKIASADFDGDGNRDLYVHNGFSPQIYLGNGSGGFTSATIDTSNWPTGLPAITKIIASDLNGDGSDDLLAVGGGQAFYQMSNGDDSFASRITLPGVVDAKDIAAVDIDNDGFKDIVVSLTAQTLLFLQEPPAPAPQPVPTPQPVSPDPIPLYVGGQNTHSFALSDDFGWLSHNTLDNPGIIYGMDINQTTGEVTGYGWNQMFGWIDFNPVGPYPNPLDYPGTSAQSLSYNPADGKLSGWAKIYGWGNDGWVAYRYTVDGNEYGVTVAPDGAMSGFAYNALIGYIDYQPQYGGVVYDPENPLAPQTTYGWAWNDTYGWISHRYTDWLIDYGVDVDVLTGVISGFAWNDTIGWVQYDHPGPYPSAPLKSAEWDINTDEVSGWIYAVDQDKWISTRGTTGTPGNQISYGVSMDVNTGDWSGRAWSDYYGWIDYDWDLGGGQSGNVYTEIEPFPPMTPVLISPISTTAAPNCIDTYTLSPTSPLQPGLGWSPYSSIGPSAQKTYQVQVDNNSDFSSPIIDSTPASSTSSNYGIGLGQLTWGTVYYWRVRVQNTADLWSEWGTQGASGEFNCFKTALHPAPSVNFSFIPNPPLVGVDTAFTDLTTTYGGSTIASWSWEFGDGIVQTGSNPSEDQNPVHKYTEQGPKSIKLKVIDSDGYQGAKTIIIDVNQDLPEFHRVIPR